MEMYLNNQSYDYSIMQFLNTELGDKVGAAPEK